MDRKDFLTMSVAGGIGTLFSNRAAEKERVFYTQKALKITAVKAYAFKRATYVKIETDAGVSGWGEGDHDNSRLVAAVVEQVCRPELIGEDPFQSEYLWRQMYFKGEDAGQSGLLPGAIAGVDNALWDLKGKLLGMPVAKLLGGAKQEKVRVYGSFGRSQSGGYRSPDEMAKIAVDFVKQGYKAVKARMQIRQLNIDPYPDDVFEVVKAIRKAIGDEILLFVDFNNGYRPARAIMQAKKLYEHFNIAGVEEPVTYQNYHDLAQVVAAVDVPILAGEHEFNKWQMRELIITGNVDILNTDVIKGGGITEGRKIAAMAAAFDKSIMVHNTRPTLASCASLQLVASLTNAGRFQEYAGPRKNMQIWELFENDITFEDGFLHVPQLPGLGLKVRTDKMESMKLNQ